MTYAECILPEFDQEMASTRKTLERVPEGRGDFKPLQNTTRTNWSKAMSLVLRLKRIRPTGNRVVV